MDPLYEVFEQLGKAPIAADLLAKAWRETESPSGMVRLLAAAGSDECDAAARVAVTTAAEILRREDPHNESIDELVAGSRRPTVCAELSRLLFNTWCTALQSPERRDEYEAEIAARVREAVTRPPSATDLEPPPRRIATTVGASHLATAIADPRRLVPLDVKVPAGSRVASPESFGRGMPELGGLACERVFGPWWPRTSTTEDDRVERWGYIELGRPCVHPIVPGATLTVLPVVPPHFRRWTSVSIEDLKRHARERRAALEARDDLCDPPDKILAEAGLDDPDAIEAPGLREHRLDTVYRAFINLDRSARRLAELGAPAQVVEQTTDQLDTWSSRLVGVWRSWLAELPADTDAAWALRALACRA